MLDNSSNSGYFLKTMEGPFRYEALYPPPTNRDLKGCLNTSLLLEVTLLLLFHSYSSIVFFMFRVEMPHKFTNSNVRI